MESVTIANMALGMIGQTSIQSLTAERSQEAGWCNTYYDACRRELLERSDWTFARRRRTLTLSGEAPSTWTYAYSVPNDLIKDRLIENPTDRSPRVPFPYEIAANESLNQRLLFTDVKEAVLVYTADVTNVNLFSPLFVSGLSMILAAKITMPLTRKSALLNDVEKWLTLTMPFAIASDANRGQRDEEPVSSYEAGRL